MMMDGGVPEGSFSVVNFCQILYATTSGPKIGANNQMGQLGYEQSLQYLDPDHPPFLQTVPSLACSLRDCSLQLSPGCVV